MNVNRMATLAAAPAALSAGAQRRGSVADFIEMTKPRLSLMSVISAVAGYLLAVPPRDYGGFFGMLLGTAFAAGGAAVLNQWMERVPDAAMRRTQERPLPAGRVGAGAAFVVGLALCLAGVGIMCWLANLLAAGLAAATVLLYLLAYTPLKQRSSWATVVGALPGALPPLIGWVAATGGIGRMGVFLFAVLFVWQLPHFMAISWMFRDDYARGGFRTLSVRDASGGAVARSALLWSLLLLGAVLLPLLWGGVGLIYLAGVAPLCGWMLGEAYGFLRLPDRDAAARRLFFTSITWLPAFLVLLLVDRYVY